jgi:seryl-tRNA synthetase
MLRPDEVIASLWSRGELWSTAPGVVGMRGDLAALYSAVSAAIGGFARSGYSEQRHAPHATRQALNDTVEEWCMPSVISFDALERAQYFETFPHWLTAASHLSDENNSLERVAKAKHPGVEAASSLERATSALPPAVCYHTYAALADSTLESSIVMTAEETCWRHEGKRLAALERGWAFRMREIVFLGQADEAEGFRQTRIESVSAFAESIGLDAHVELATDPFFAPTSRGKALLQRVKALKHELVVDRPDGSGLAISSFNNHERFFGDAFGIRLLSGESATSACVAFGIERWMLAILMTHGVEPSSWPLLESAAEGVTP